MINVLLVHQLITSQFPQWKDLAIQPVALSGWDNRTFHLGDEMLIRMPSAEPYSYQVEKEQKWLPYLAPHLPLSIPAPIALGMPGQGYPWKWSIYRWIEGESATRASISNLNDLAKDLAHFLIALQDIDASEGPPPGAHNFHRGGSLSVYDSQTKEAIELLKGKIDQEKALAVWEKAMKTSWENKPRWVHGDISIGNLLMKQGKLAAVIDFGQLAVGDPACDLAIAWTLFKGESRELFRQELHLDEGTWDRGRAWALWKALIVAAQLVGNNNIEGENCWQIIEDILRESLTGFY